jgi:hypothetical protein
VAEIDGSLSAAQPMAALRSNPAPTKSLPGKLKNHKAIERVATFRDQ